MSATNEPSETETLQQEQQRVSAEEEMKRKKKNANSYYYWHGHEKERQRVGDVAPMPTPVLLKKVDEVAPVEAAMVFPITKYSWCDGTKAVTVYVETKFEGQETMQADTLYVEFRKRKLTVFFIANVETTTASIVQRRKQLVLHLSKAIKDKESSYKVKESSGQIVLRLVKEDESSWWDLVDKSGNAQDDDSDDETHGHDLHSSGNDPE